MNNRNSSFLGFFILYLLACGSDQVESLQELETGIQSVIEDVDGDFAVVFKEIGTPGNTLMINPDEMFHAASTMKTPVMIEVFKQASEGRFNLSDSVEVKNEFTSIVDGSPFSLNIDRDGGDGMYEYIGKKRTIWDLTHDMITVSGNLATNNVIEIVGAENANASMHELGAHNIKVLRGVEDMKAFELGMSNETTARDLAVIFERLAECDFIDAESCKGMIEILSDQKITAMIPAGLPDDIKVAHKTGSITGISHDSGIVYLPDGRSYVLVILSKNLPDASEGTAAGAKISRLVYEFMSS